MNEAETDLTETSLESESVFDGKLLHVRCDKVRLPDGGESLREYVVHPGAVVVLARLDDGRLLFERQFRYPLRRVFVELPAGKIDPGEDIVTCGRRELLEETGYEASVWRHLGTMHPCIGYSDERIEICLAEGLRKVAEPNLDAAEFLEVFSLTLEEARAGVLRGQITDGKTIAALYWAEHLVGKQLP